MAVSTGEIARQGDAVSARYTMASKAMVAILLGSLIYTK